MEDEIPAQSLPLSKNIKAAPHTPKTNVPHQKKSIPNDAAQIFRCVIHSILQWLCDCVYEATTYCALSSGFEQAYQNIINYD
jgi:hypothetical protein